MIPYGRQHITDEDIQAVVEVLKSDYLTQGPMVPSFEKAICYFTGAKYAVAVNSGTSALHLACIALDLKEGDWLWTTPNTFVASANCGLYCGAMVDFVDIDPDSWNISITSLEVKLQTAKKQDRLPKIIVPVHLCGLSCDMEAIYELSQKYGFYIIEDASHAIGGKYNDEYIGGCRYSDITVFSFHPVKVMTTGEGGMAATNNPGLSSKMCLLRSHGITREPELMTTEPDGPWSYQQLVLGFNYRMTDIQAALGISQLKRLDDFIRLRHEIAIMYDNRLSSLPVQRQYQSTDKYSSMHLYVIRLKLEKIKRSHKQVFEFLREQGIGVNLHYIPVHTQPYYQEMGYKIGDFPVAEQYYQEAISLPIFYAMHQDQIDDVVFALEKALR